MADFDVIVIGGGPAGYSAALTAAERGASVALIEAEKLGGSCVNHACIPTNILLGSALAHAEVRELGLLGVFDVGEQFHLGRAAARKDALVRKLADGIATALRMRKVTRIEGRGSLAGPSSVFVDDASGRRQLSAEAIIIATGTRWDPPAIPGVAPDRILTADAVQSLPEAPTSALVLGGGPGAVDFGLEYAVLLALAGSSVTFATPADCLIAGFDPQLEAFARQSLESLGIVVHLNARPVRGEGDAVVLASGGAETAVAAAVVVAPDVRRPFIEGLNLPTAGLPSTAPLAVDRGCRTTLPGIFAAGDVTGGSMLSSAASHMGEVAATNATGGEAVTRLGTLPHLLHLLPEAGWIGVSEAQARAAGHDVISGTVDLAYNARAVTLGAREGMVKVVAERELGEILGVQAVGPAASEVLAVAAVLMQSEGTVHDLAATIHWHPSLAEALAEAARRAK